jgi:U4/U6 small nuclear ribonucleoprotein PRP4
MTCIIFVRLSSYFSFGQTFETKALQFGDDRPLSYCTFSPNSKLLATGSWSGLVKLWTVPGSEHVHSFKGHTERISGIDFHPLSTRGQAKAALNMVSGAADGSVHMWSFDRYDN